MSDIPPTENDAEAYREAADRVTADADAEVWVVQERRGDEWSVAAVLPTYDDAEAYIEDLRTFKENCPEDSPEEFCRSRASFRVGSRHSPTKLFEEWPPDHPDA